jgi:hypothetical protein
MLTCGKNSYKLREKKKYNMVVIETLIYISIVLFFRGTKSFGVFRVKNHDFTPNNHIFFQFNLRVAPLLNPPLVLLYKYC